MAHTIQTNSYRFLHDLILANQNKTFIFTYSSGDVFKVVFDMEFDDDGSSTDAEFLAEVTYKTISLTIEKIVTNVSKHYREGDVILLTPATVPTKYELV